MIFILMYLYQFKAVDIILLLFYRSVIVKIPATISLTHYIFYLVPRYCINMAVW